MKISLIFLFKLKYIFCMQTSQSPSKMAPCNLGPALHSNSIISNAKPNFP